MGIFVIKVVRISDEPSPTLTRTTQKLMFNKLACPIENPCNRKSSKSRGSDSNLATQRSTAYRSPGTLPSDAPSQPKIFATTCAVSQPRSSSNQRRHVFHELVQRSGHFHPSTSSSSPSGLHRNQHQIITLIKHAHSFRRQTSHLRPP